MQLTGGRKVTAVTAALVILAASCSTSQVDPDADITIAGQVVRQDGSAASDARVALTKEPDFFDVILTVASVGLACLLDEIPNACDDVEVQSAASDGGFSFERKGRDTQGFAGTASTLGLSASLDPAQGQATGPGTTIRFQVQTEQLGMPIAFWEPTVSFSSDAKTAKASWSELTEASLPQQGSVGEARIDLQFRSRGQLVWRFPNQDRSVSFDARVLEETKGDMALVAYLDDVDVDPEQGVEWDLLLRSGAVAYEGKAGIPDSRGRPCSVSSGGESQQMSPCTLTDGNYQDGMSPEAACPPEGVCEGDAQFFFSVDLGDALDISLVVVRGCGSECVVETSNDESSWSAFATGTPPDAAEHDDVILPPPGATQARYVRVSTQTSPADLRELSVFDPVPEQPETPAPPPQAEGLGGIFADADEGPGGIPWLWIGIGLIVVVGAAILIARRRREGQPEPSPESPTP